MKIAIRAFSDYRKYLPLDAPPSGLILEVKDGMSIEEVLAHLSIPLDSPKVLTVNDINQKPEYRLSNNDILKIFPVAKG